jgi:hypothetical protein
VGFFAFALSINTIMTVRFICSIASDAFSYRPGQVAEIDDELATKWALCGICFIEPVVPVVPDITPIPAPKTRKKVNA